jgi:drug/metabolite transporter (DMT)-like permease
MMIKHLSQSMPAGQIIAMLGVGGALAFGAMARARGQRLLSSVFFSRAVLLRNMGELIGTLCFVLALALIPLSTASAILQAMPLAVTLGAALFMGAQVGWRRWAAILVGFAGVLMIIRPGTDAFQLASLLPVVTVIALAVRDLATRMTPPEVSSLQLSTYAFVMLVPTGLLLLLAGGEVVVPTPWLWAQYALTLCFAIAAYYMIVGAMRLGEVAVVTPFRYARLIFALIIGVIVFAERPDGWMLAGAVLIIASGLYIVFREARRGVSTNRPVSRTRARGESVAAPRPLIVEEGRDDASDGGSR